MIIEKNRSNRELLIEFTGKILEDAYPELISSQNIRQCFENINKQGICQLNIDAILQDATVVKCDVTQDVVYDNLRRLTSGIRSSIFNSNKYLCRPNGDNLTITNNVSTRNRKIRLVIYDKERESNNRVQAGAFANKIRFEMNLTSMAQIRERLKITDNALSSVLNSTATPILDFLNKIIVGKNRMV